QVGRCRVAIRRQFVSPGRSSPKRSQPKSGQAGRSKVKSQNRQQQARLVIAAQGGQEVRPFQVIESASKENYMFSRKLVGLIFIVPLTTGVVSAEDKPAGQRVFYTGHSFHMFVPPRIE